MKLPINCFRERTGENVSIMRIDSAAVGMESARSFSAVSFSFRRFEETDFSGVMSGKTSEGENPLLTKDDLSKEEEGGKNSKSIKKDAIVELRERIEAARKNYHIRNYEDTTVEKIRNDAIMYILDLLFGDAKEAIKKRLEERINGGSSTAVCDEGQVTTLENTEGDFPQDPAALLTMPVKRVKLQAVDYYEESEDTKFSSKGIVRTADGREINFNIDVSMSRRFVQETKLDLGISFVKTCDPLVINLNDNIANVSDTKIRFDIDGDGELDTVNRLSSGSGYLALDKNGDGKINDGNELFGSKSGDGFADLAKYDLDHNGWIDEADEIWDKLKIWVTDENGHEQLYSLSEAGIGAFCLSKVATDFADTDENNNKKAFVRSTGIFLYESGAVGTLQHLDLVKYEKEA